MNGIFSLFAQRPKPLELGFKVEAFERRLGVNTALFLGFYDDIQVATTRNLGDIDGDGLDNFERVVENAAKATIMGAEVESWWRPVDELLLTANLSLLESRYDDYISTDDVALPAVPGEAPPARNRAGESFNRVPKQKYNAAVQYSIPIEPDDPDWLWGELTPRVDWSYRSKVHYFGPELTEATQRGFNLLNARLTYQFNDSHSQIALWAKNLTDERHFDDAFTLATVFNTVTRFYGEPRTYGIEITHNF